VGGRLVWWGGLAMLVCSRLFYSNILCRSSEEGAAERGLAGAEQEADQRDEMGQTRPSCR
jgi:hypothetical protein